MSYELYDFISLYWEDIRKKHFPNVPSFKEWKENKNRREREEISVYTNPDSFWNGMADDFSLHHIDDQFRHIRGMIGNPLNVFRDK